MIYCAYPKAQYLRYKDEIKDAINNVLESGNYILNTEVEAFEKEFSEYLSVPETISCGNGTDAIFLALKALDITSDDEVIVPSHTAVPTVAAIVMSGATPVYVDIESEYFTIDPLKIEIACTNKTKAIISVHLYGQAASLDEIQEICKKKNLFLIEDCAQAVGGSYKNKKLGTIGDISCFSFFPTKNLGAIGDGGAVVCKSSELANKVKQFRQYGWDENRVSEFPGVNSRLDEIQAAILRVKLNYLDTDNNERIKQAKYYTESLNKQKGIKIPEVKNIEEHVFHLYVIQVNDRGNFMKFMLDNGVHLGIHYPVPVHKMPAYSSAITLPITEKISKKIVSLPLYPGMSKSDQDVVVTSIKKYFK